MDNESLFQNPAQTNPTLTDLLNLHRKGIMLDLNCHHIGTIQSFDPATQTAQLTINYKKTVFVLDPGTQTYQPQLVDYPVAADCPVVFLGGGPGALTFPVAKGDECLVFFNDRDMDNWFAGSTPGTVATPRLHSFSDAIALVGVRSKPNFLQNFDTDRVVLANGSTIVGVGASLIKLANQTYTLNQLLQELITDVKSLVSATAGITVTGVSPGLGVSGPPFNAAAILAVNTSLDATATKIGALLE